MTHGPGLNYTAECSAFRLGEAKLLASSFD